MNCYDVAVIGGGASGLMASIFAAQELENGKVVILERNDRVGKKILSTGNGRCNFTNSEIAPDRYHGEFPEFVVPVFEKFTLENTLEFFAGLGILAKKEERNKMFPNSFQAASVLDVLRYRTENLGIKEICSFKCCEIVKTDGMFELLSEDKKSIISKKVIVATGGMAAPNMGTDGNGYSLLEKYGHKKTKPAPSLVQLKCPPKSVIAMKGVRLDVNIRVIADDVTVNSAFGELLFTEYGISGPAVFDVSRAASVALNEGKKVYAVVDLIPFLNDVQLEEHLKKRNRNITAENFLNGMINKLLGKQLMKKAGIEKLSFDMKNAEDEFFKKLTQIIKNCRFEITGTNSWNNAQTTAGGIIVSGFNSETMESKLERGIYSCGEILDIDGDCGGFNLQWAWSSGAVAGLNAAKSVKEEKYGC